MSAEATRERAHSWVLALYACGLLVGFCTARTTLLATFGWVAGMALTAWVASRQFRAMDRAIEAARTQGVSQDPDHAGGGG